MSPLQHEIGAREYCSYMPRFESIADELMAGLRGMPTQEIAERLKLGQKSAPYARECIYDFPDKRRGARALEAYTGTVFKALDAGSLERGAREWLDGHLLIVSSLYGLLKPRDIIKPYRLDFSSKIAPEGKALSAYWRAKLTVALVKHMGDMGEGEVLSLLPMDAHRCFDWKLIRRFASVATADFRLAGSVAGMETDTESAERMRTPPAEKLKRMRGLLTRHLAEMRGIRMPHLRDLETEFALACGTTSEYPERFMFVTD